MSTPPLNYNPDQLPRETKQFYISASEQDIQEMLSYVGAKDLSDLFAHIPDDVKMGPSFKMDPELEYQDLIKHMVSLSQKNSLPKASFIGDGLQHYKLQEIVPHVLSLRELTTAYTPYQPERSQGTLMTHWIYQSTMSMLTGFEAINVSMYDRATTLHEALLATLRIKKKKNTCIVFDNIYPGDKEVLESLIKETKLKIEWLSIDPHTGCIDIGSLNKKIAELKDDLAAVAFPHINTFGNIENVDKITDLCKDNDILSVAIIDPLLLAKGALKPPAQFGQKGTDLFVAEGQHLAIEPSFGGPGLGVIGFRFNAEHKNDIRSAPGRFVGSGFDSEGRVCKTQVISAREQHIKREKATSNICSNQAYIATVAGAAILARGDQGFEKSCEHSKALAYKLCTELCSLEGIELKFADQVFYNEFTLKLNKDASELIASAREEQLHIGVDLSNRNNLNESLLKISLSDQHSEKDLDELIKFFENHFSKSEKEINLPEISTEQIRKAAPGIPTIKTEELKKFYTNLASQNVSPDDAPYPLGSCTMKYNPYVNDYAAALDGFFKTHPQAPLEDNQGNLQILFETQEIFKEMLGLDSLTTQPVAGAQGELVGLKMIQAFHRDKGENRDIILIPRSAHGTNPATASYAGFETQSRRGEIKGVVLVEAEETGLVDLDHLKSLISDYGPRIAGIMVTNPNTSGIFENNFKTMAELIHDCGGLVYMDGANLNAIAGWIHLGKMGVDAVHSNLHKTWTIPHGGGGPGDAIVAVSHHLTPYLPGVQVIKEGENYKTIKAPKSIGSIHRHFGNFGHKIRCYTYLRRLGPEGVRKMSAFAVLSARYLSKKLTETFSTLPVGCEVHPCMHEFIITLSKELFQKIEASGIPKSAIIGRIGKLFLDFGFHAPTIAFPEVYGIMIEPTESYTKSELDRFADAVLAIHQLIDQHPEVLQTVPHFTPIDRVDDVTANRKLVLSEKFTELPEILDNRIPPKELAQTDISVLSEKILAAHKEALNPSA